jgi:hypothetical protein
MDENKELYYKSAVDSSLYSKTDDDSGGNVNNFSIFNILLKSSTIWASTG